MEKLNSEDGQLFIKNLARFIRTHEKALANALQLRRQPVKHASSSGDSTSSPSSSTLTSTSSTLAAALSFGALKFTSQNIKPAKLTLTPHHLFYLLSRFEDLGVLVGPMNIRLQNIQAEVLPSYVSFLNKPKQSKGDRDSIHSVSSVRSVMSGMSALWSSIGWGSGHSLSKSEKARAALEADLKYLYSAFTKIPCLRLAPDHRAQLIRGYEEFPFDTAVPLHCFKNLSALEIIDVDFRSFYGWDRLSEQLRSLIIKRANLEDPADLLIGIVLDDIDKRRRRSAKSQTSPAISCSGTSNPQPFQSPTFSNSISAPGSPVAESKFSPISSPQATSMARIKSDGLMGRPRAESHSPTPFTSSQHPGYSRQSRGSSARMRRTGSGSSNSSETSSTVRTGSSTNLLAGVLPPSKWRFLRHLGLPDNSLTSLSAASILPVANTLHSLDLSSNLFSEVPDSLASLVALRALNLSYCMISSLHSLSRNPLPAITALNLRGNRLSSLAGVERLLSLERLDLRDNNLSDPMEIARLTSLPEIREIWVKGNPFVKTHAGYRTVIFNLFRRTPGYLEDIIIDGSGPGYTERKQLVDRVAEPEGAPVIRPNDLDDAPVIHKVSSALVDGSSLTKSMRDRNERRLLSAYEVESSRRKKAPRRKIVDLALDTSRPSDELNRGAAPTPTAASVQQFGLLSDPFVFIAPDAKSRKDGGSLIEPAATQRPEQRSHRQIIPSSAMREAPGTLIPSIRKTGWDKTPETYHQPIEALRHEFGNSWLAVLDDHSWEATLKEISARHAGSVFKPPGLSVSPMAGPPSYPIVSGATLS